MTQISTQDLTLDSLPQTLKNLYLRWSFNSNPAKVVSFLSCFPALTPGFGDSHLSDLPPNLTKLKLIGMQSMFGLRTAIPKLPRGLKTLRLNPGTITSASCCDFPRSLTDLCVGIVMEGKYSDSQLENHVLELPRSITNLRLQVYVL